MSFHGSIPGLGTDVVPQRRGSSGSRSPQRSGHHWPYRAVHVLLIYWKDGTKDFYDQLRELSKEFKGSYKYQVEEWAIESEGPYKKLNERLLKFLKYDQDGALLIVYYGGHGGINKDKNHTWLCHDPSVIDAPSNPTVNWSSLQQLLLNDCLSHILLILDCCKAAASIQYTQGFGVVEAITAAGFENVTPLRGPHSFTTNLILTLKEFHNTPITASNLCGKLATRLKYFWPREEGSEKRVTPHHFTLSDYVDTERIVIAKFQKISSSTGADSESRPQLTIADSTISATNSAVEDGGTGRGLSMPMVSNAKEEVRPQVRRSEIPVPGLNVHSLPTSPPPTLNFHTPDSSPETSKPGFRNYRKPGIASSKRPGIGSQMKWDSLHGGTYRYNPLGLGEIRVLHLLAGKKDDQIHCAFSPIQIQNVNAGNPIPNYHAVSYYWEDKPPLDEIQIFTGTHQFEATYETLLIRPTLYAALRRLRDEQKIVLLWIDALCINQNDDEEKTIQVVMMPQIFYKACHVCVWLGEDANGSETMHTFLPKLLDLAQVDKIVEKESTPEQWQAFSALMMRAWFNRRWMIQELISAEDVTLYCGETFWIEWKDFCDAVALFGAKFDAVRELFRLSPAFNHNPDHLVDIRALSAYTLIEASRNIFRQSLDVESTTGRRLADLETLVSNLPAQQTSDPRDTIYALLSISSDAQPHTFEVDYNKNSTQVFKDFIQFCVNRSKSIDVICRHWAPEPVKTPRNVSHAPQWSRLSRPKDDLLPSWVPRVSGLPFGARGRNRYGRNNGDSLVGTPKRRFYNASKGTTGMVIFGEIETPADDDETPAAMSPAIGTQNIQSGNFDTGIQINRAPSASSFSFHQTPSQQSSVDNDGDETQTVRRLDGSMTVSGFKLSEIVELGAKATGGAILADWIEMGGWREDDTSVPEYFWRSLVADRGPDGIPPPAWYHRACLYCLEQSGGGDITLADLTIESCPSMAIEFLNRVRNVIWNRKFFRTSKEPGKGFFGLAPPKAERGDVICILYGCSVPVVLSPRSEIPGSWELVGECFVYGMMDGEAMATDQARHPQEFELR